MRSGTWGHGLGLLRDVGQQVERVDGDLGGDPLDTLQGQVPFASFDAAHVGPMDLKDIGEGFLAQSAGISYRPQVPADGALQVSFGHRETVPVCYLTVYRLISSVAALKSTCRPRGARHVDTSTLAVERTL